MIVVVLVEVEVEVVSQMLYDSLEMFTKLYFETILLTIPLTF